MESFGESTKAFVNILEGTVEIVFWIWAGTITTEEITSCWNCFALSFFTVKKTHRKCARSPATGSCSSATQQTWSMHSCANHNDTLWHQKILFGVFRFEDWSQHMRDFCKTVCFVTEFLHHMICDSAFDGVGGVIYLLLSFTQPNISWPTTVVWHCGNVIAKFNANSSWIYLNMSRLTTSCGFTQTDCSR